MNALRLKSYCVASLSISFNFSISILSVIGSFLYCFGINLLIFKNHLLHYCNILCIIDIDYKNEYIM